MQHGNLLRVKFTLPSILLATNIDHCRSLLALVWNDFHNGAYQNTTKREVFSKHYLSPMHLLVSWAGFTPVWESAGQLEWLNWGHRENILQYNFLVVTTESHEGKANCVADFQPLTIAHSWAIAWPMPKVERNSWGWGRVWMYHMLLHGGRGKSSLIIQFTTISFENPDSTIYLLSGYDLTIVNTIRNKFAWTWLFCFKKI